MRNGSYIINLDEPSPYTYAARTVAVHSGGVVTGKVGHVIVSYDDCNTSQRFYITAQDARALALKLLGAAMDAEQLADDPAVPVGV